MARNPAGAPRKHSVELRFGIELGGSRKVIRNQSWPGVADRPILEITKSCICCARPIESLFYCRDCVLIVQAIQRIVRHLVTRAGLRVGKGTICVDCRKAWALVFDHRHYAKPYDVDPVCRACNVKRGPARDVPRLVSAYKRVFL